MPPFELEPRIANADAFYAALAHAQDGLTLEQSFALMTRLALILANQVGDLESLMAALRMAARAPGDG